MTPSWTLSGFADEISADPNVQVAVLEALGIAHIEVRSAWDVNIVDMTPEQVGTLAALFRTHGIGTSAVASPIGKVDVTVDPESEVQRLRRVIEAAHAFEARYVRIFSFYPAGRTPDAMRDDVLVRMAALAKLAEQEDVILLHENEKAIYGETPQRCLDIIESVGSPALRVAWDPANFVQVGVARPFTDGYAMLRPYLEYLQVKDAKADGGQVVPAGEGDGQLLATLAALHDDGYTGFASMEPHLAAAHGMGGFSGPAAFGVATRAFTGLLDRVGVSYK